MVAAEAAFQTLAEGVGGLDVEILAVVLRVAAPAPVLARPGLADARARAGGGWRGCGTRRVRTWGISFRALWFLIAVI